MRYFAMFFSHRVVRVAILAMSDPGRSKLHPDAKVMTG